MELAPFPANVGRERPSAGALFRLDEERYRARRASASGNRGERAAGGPALERGELSEPDR